MSLATLYTRANGLDAPAVTIEVHLSNGLPQLSIVGLPEAAVKESKDRVRAAILNSEFEFPARRITVNLAPADLPKEGGRFDLPIALGILAASGQIPLERLDRYEFAGELALSGELRPIPGVLPLSIQAHKMGRNIVVPKQSAKEAALVQAATILPAAHLLEVCAHLHGHNRIESISCVQKEFSDSADQLELDMADVYGQHQARRALELAAAGGHNLLLYGPPGTGKTMLASRLASILPRMSEQESTETAAVYSISNRGFSVENWGKRPFRAPHHSASSVALVGGGNPPKPGEVSLAHNGVLFLDELPEFDRKVLEVLREPLEAGQITIARAAFQADFPARFQLIAAMNPCPCGYLGHPNGKCRCTSEQIGRYRSRISGPLLDRIDMQVEVPPLPQHELQKKNREMESSQTIHQRVVQSREKQLSRQALPNAQLSSREIEKYCGLDDSCQQLITRASNQLGLSARAHHRIRRVARTIADLAQSDEITPEHLAEAIGYRQLDRG
ncbi:MAG: YifB family Mg chelatase-like AAA ATPase [Gammaproteobacteria bacterium]|nr:YifB family Mg chelatase-like AAA ATPase [Gammaproteobacteria bacterium]